jgi:hypothetical protein
MQSKIKISCGEIYMSFALKETLFGKDTKKI